LETNRPSLHQTQAGSVGTSGLAFRGVDLDTFVTTLWELTPDDVVSVVDSLIHKRSRRPVSKSEMVEALQSHMPNLAGSTRLSGE